jgi:holliday junction DNA helicase RuvB
MTEKPTPNRHVSPQRKTEDRGIDGLIRPQLLNEFIGQEKLKTNLTILIEAAKARQEPLDHVLFHGPPGLGKTTLAHVVANEMNVNIRITAGPAIERAGDLAAILTNLRAGDILFIDEVHRLGRAVEEILYPAMEDFVLDIIVGKGPGAKNVRLKLPKFTVIGATTRLALITAPLRARFGAVYRMDFYEQEAVETIVTRGAKILDVACDSVGATEIARRSRGTPRVALRLLRRVRDYTQVRSDGRITEETAVAALNLLEIDPLGLDDLDRRVLRAIIEKFGGGPVGLETIAASISEESDTIMDVVEPYLLQLGFLERTARGRLATPHAYKHLNIPLPLSRPEKTISQPSLFNSEEQDG